MSRIDSHNPQVTRIGDNRHSPLSLVHDNILPYRQRGKQHRKNEAKIMIPLEKIDLKKATQRTRAQFERLKNGRR